MSVDIDDIIEKLNSVLENATNADIHPDDRDKLYGKKHNLSSESLSEGAKHKLKDIIDRIEAHHKSGKANDPHYRDLIDRFSKMNITERRREVIRFLLELED